MFNAHIKNTKGGRMKLSRHALFLSILFTVFLAHLPNEKARSVAFAAAITSCADCHGNPPVDGTRSGATGQFLGSHNKHTGSGATQYAMVCTRCHYNNTAYNHRNSFINISGSSVRGNSYSEGKSKATSNTPAFGSCSNLYCHSRKVNDARANVAVAVAWNSTMPSDCTGCHGGDRDSVLPMSADLHTAHVNKSSGRFAGLKIKCYECHFNTVNSDNRTLKPAAYGVAGIHADGTPTVSWGPSNAGRPAYSSAVSCGWNAAVSGTYCHSSAAGTAAPNQNPGTWNAAADGTQANNSCVYCHNGTVADAPFTQSTNKHSLHLNVIPGNIPNNEFSCSRCHAYTMRPDNSVFTNSTSLHFNQVRDVRFKTPFSNRSGSYAAGTNTCSNTYCHGGGASGNWVSGTPRNCGSCHAGGRNNPIRWSPPHNRHYSSTTVSTWANGWRGENRSVPTITQFSCGVCHNVKDKHVSGPPVLNQGDAQLTFNFYTAWGPRAVSRPSASTKSATNLTQNLRMFYYSPETTCSVYCHSNGKNNFITRNVKWTAGTVSCGSGACHQVGNVMYNWSSAHTKHVDSYIRGGNPLMRCNSCHTGTVSTAGVIINRQRHVNGFANVSSSTINVGGNTTFIYTPGTQTCSSNNYCHSNGRATTAARRYSNIVWTATSNCTTCHGGKSGSLMVGSASGFMLSSSHRKHLSNTPYNCSACHYKTAASELALKNFSGVIYHLNQSRNVIINAPGGFGSYTSYKAGVSRCENTSCHGGITRNAWATPNTGHTCSKCHGVNGTNISVSNSGDSRKFFAPGWNSIGTDSDSNVSRQDRQVGAHFKHLSSVFMKKIKCNECHVVPDSVSTAGHNDTLRFVSPTIIFTQASTAKLNGATGATLAVFTGFTSGTAVKAATCSSVYCHGNRIKYGVSNGSYRKPYWNFSGMTNNSSDRFGGVSGTCGRCHGNPPDTVSSSHGTAIATTGCATCHGQVVDATGRIINKALHINGKVEGPTACNGCHSYDTTGGGTAWGNTNYGTFGQGSGAHAKHIEYLKTRWGGLVLDPTVDFAGNISVGFGTGNPAKVCGTCHTNLTANHLNTSRQINFGDGLTSIGTSAQAVTFGTTPIKVYNGASTTNSTTQPKTCSNISCHYFTTPNWTSF